MATKAELEAQVAELEGKLAKTEKALEKAQTTAVEAVTIQPPSPVTTGQMYVESHPTLGVLRTAHVTAMSDGDGHEGDGATIVRTS